VRTADHLLEVASELFPQAGPKPRAFEVLLRGMRSIAEGEPPAETARKAEAEFLAIGGWAPTWPGAVNARKRRPVPTGFSLRGRGPVRRPVARRGIPPLPRRRKDVARPAGGGDGRTRSAPDSVVIAEELRVVIPGYVEYCLGKQLRSLGGK